jgi:hypothetical protein
MVVRPNHRKHRNQPLGAVGDGFFPFSWHLTCNFIAETVFLVVRFGEGPYWACRPLDGVPQ